MQFAGCHRIDALVDLRDSFTQVVHVCDGLFAAVRRRICARLSYVFAVARYQFLRVL
jgi:hypothetical protein